MKSILWLLAAAATEVGWVTGIAKAGSSALAWLATAVCIVASVALAFKATRDMAATTVYAMFVGLGALGTVGVDLIVFNAHFGPATLGFLVLLVAGIVGLRLTATEDA